MSGKPALSKIDHVQSSRLPIASGAGRMISLYLQTDILGGIPEDTTGVHRITQPLGTPRVLQTTTGLATGATTTGAVTAGRTTQPRGTPSVLQ